MNILYTTKDYVTIKPMMLIYRCWLSCIRLKKGHQNGKELLMRLQGQFPDVKMEGTVT